MASARSGNRWNSWTTTCCIAGSLAYRRRSGVGPDDLHRERLQAGEVFKQFMIRLVNHPQVKPLLSDQHFSVGGTLVEAWASQRSFLPKTIRPSGSRALPAWISLGPRNAQPEPVGSDGDVLD